MSVFHFSWIMCHFMVGLSSFFFLAVLGDVFANILFDKFCTTHITTLGQTEQSQTLSWAHLSLVDLVSLLLLGICQAWWPEQSVEFGSQCLVLCFAVLSLWLLASHWAWLRACSFMCLLDLNKNFSQCKKYLQYLCLIFAGRCYIKKPQGFTQTKIFLFFFLLFFSSFLKSGK